MDFILKNKEWLFSGLGITILGVLWWGIDRLLRKWTKQGRSAAVLQEAPISTDSQVQLSLRLDTLKNETTILFVDDDTSFKVVKILQAAGWIHTHILRDLNSLDDLTLRAARIVFVDIQGVGRILEFRDEGLGLTQRIKERYPEKFVVVYSAETRGNRIHQGLKIADDFLPKNAEPYEFQKIIEDALLEGLTK